MYNYKIQKILKKWKKESGAMRVIQYTYKNFSLKKLIYINSA